LPAQLINVDLWAGLSVVHRGSKQLEWSRWEQLVTWMITMGVTCNLNDHGGPSFWHPSAQEPPVIAIDSGTGKELWPFFCSFDD
jgi:hypothetical protein